jgi:hypothetical protein
MSAWAAIEARDAATTTSLGSGILHGISNAALGGFAIGAVLTGLCFLVIVAPRSRGWSRLSARPAAFWPAFLRRPRVERDYYAAPADTYPPDADAYSLSAESEMVFAAAPVEDLLDDAPEAAEFVVPEDFPALSLSQDYEGHAGADPYAIETAAELAAEPLFEGTDVEVDGQSRPESSRGYRSKHRLTDQDPSGRRADGRRSAPRHAAPSARIGGRISSKLAMFPLVAARG